MIVNVHRKNTSNQGDKVSAPLRYLRHDQSDVFIDILDCLNPDPRINAYLDAAEWIIVGGGGLLSNDKFHFAFLKLRELYAQKIIFWGGGTNAIKNAIKNDIDVDLEGVNYVGIRDVGTQFPWVPCASCMSDIFPKIIKNRERYAPEGIGLLENNAGRNTHGISSLGFKDIRKFGNKNVTMLQMVEFIASCETLVTSSYHGLYWATLIGVPVVGIPTSSKFYHMRHPAPLAKKDTWPEKLAETKLYPEALKECVDANIKFKDSLPVSIADREWTNI